MEDPASPTSSLAPALSMEQISGKLRALHVDTHQIRALLHNTEFSSLLYKSHQVCFLHEYFPKTLRSEIDANQLAVVFEMNVRTIRKYLLHGPQDPKAPGRHRALDETLESELTAIILQAFNEGKAMTKRQVLALVRERYSPKLTKGWLHAFVARHLDALQVCRSLPQEDTRLTVPREHLEAHIENMKSIVAGKFAELVFNLDEVGSSDWEDRKPRKVIAPRAVSPDDVYHPVSRRYRHLTLLACVSAGGDALTPMVLTSSPIRDAVWSTGLREDEDAMIRFRNPAYVTEELFHEYLTNVFVPYILRLREDPVFADQLGVLLMDSVAAHISERNLRLLGENKIIALVFPAHTTNLFQALDLVFFGALKNNKEHLADEPDHSSVHGQIWKLIRAYEQTATSFTIRSSFRKAGLSPNTQARPFKLEFNEEALRQNDGFNELWDRNISIAELSSRRRIQRFGILNAEFIQA
jgi:hypothetical protein